MKTRKEIKQKYFDKVYANAILIPCRCGCGEMIKNKDKYARDKEFVNGHNKRKYKDPHQYQREWRKKHKDTIYKKKIQRGHELKKKIVEMLGGKCQRCGLQYDGKNACVFQFHHRESNNKICPINIRTLISCSWEKIQIELEKTDLLCANCHFIIENEEY